jgi:dihydroorotase
MAMAGYRPYDLLLKGGTVIDPGQEVHAALDVAFAQGMVAQVAGDIPTWQASQVVEVPGALVAPGLIDLHVHVFEGISYLGVPPDSSCLAHGVTTVVDAGSSGADTFAGFRKYVIEMSETRILAQLNISAQGMLESEIGELDELKWANVPKALQVIEKNRDLIVGIKVRLTRDSIVGQSAGLQPLYRAREAADATGLPIMVHPSMAWCASLDDVLQVMKGGDILTHSYHGHDTGILDQDRRVRPAVREARERGVLFDVGHGAGSFSWDVCETALAQGFLPDTISSDLHTGNINGPVYDLATVVTKFLHLGLSLDEALSRVTCVPAGLIGRSGHIGTLKVGNWGDAAVFDLQEGRFELADCHKQVRLGRQRLAPRLVIVRGHLYSGPAAPMRHVH